MPNEYEDIRRAFREAIEGIRRDVHQIHIELREHVSACAERKRQQDEVNKKQAEATQEVKQVVVRFLWQIIAIGSVLLAALVIGWIKLVGRGSL